VISEGQNFELGFFSPGNSSSRYVGIWYYNNTDPAVIWVANRGSPISDKSGVLRIGDDGNLMVFDGNNSEVWSSNASITSRNTTARLGISGNLILSGSDNRDYWQSFNDPTDTFLPGMRVEVNDQMGENRAFISWKSANDSSTGSYTMGVDPRGSPQIVIWEGENRRWRSGHWDGRVFLGVPNMPGNYMYGFGLSEKDNNGSRYFTYTPINSGDKLRFRIGWDGYEEQLIWEEDKGKWGVIQSQPDSANDCELYNKCGDFGVCSVSDSPICTCMKGFDPRYPDQWNRGNWSGGCLRRTQLQCQRNISNVTVGNDGEDGFFDLKCMKLPDFTDLTNMRVNESCEDKCLQNCSCVAYSEVEEIGCMIWTGDLIDIQHFATGGNTLSIRLAHADLGGKLKSHCHCNCS
jgi:hypothetical protein